MTDWLSVMERGLKAMRYGIFKASDTVADVLDGLCRAPEQGEWPAGTTVSEAVEKVHAQAVAYATQNVSPYGPHAAPGPDGVVCAHGCDAWTVSSDCDRHGSKYSAAASPAAAVVAPSPKQGSDSGPADSDILTSPAGPPPTCPTCGRSS